jgi:hypothetical protein
MAATWIPFTIPGSKTEKCKDMQPYLEIVADELRRAFLQAVAIHRDAAVGGHACDTALTYDTVIYACRF